MSASEHVLAAGDASFQELVALVEPLIPVPSETTEFGYAYGGLWAITDATLADNWYEDDRLQLSKYRFDFSSRAYGAIKWAKQVFELLSEHTDLELLWVTDLEPSRVHAIRPAPAFV